MRPTNSDSFVAKKMYAVILVTMFFSEIALNTLMEGTIKLVRGELKEIALFKKYCYILSIK